MRLVWIAAGFAALGLGAVGALLPLLPTTPFVILAAFAFGRGSPALRSRLEAHRSFGPAIREWAERGAIAARHKALACVAMAFSLAASWAAGVPVVIIAAQGAAITVAATIILSRPA